MIYRRDPEWTGVYIHFPFCIQKCDYCDFYSVGLQSHPQWRESSGRNRVAPDVLSEYLESVISEIDTRAAQFQQFRGVNTIFFGGGTASLLPVLAIERILAAIRTHFQLAQDIEITLEGNPEDFSKQYLKGLHSIGVTRVNAGIQTFNRAHLDRMNRYFDEKCYDTLLETLASCDIEAVGVDLIYGFPDQTRVEFEADLERVLSTRINHISVYSLTAEPATVYGRAVKDQTRPAPVDDLQAEIFQDLPGFLSERGFEQYEVSNFARPGFACRHNLRYWLYESYLGIGPGAHGFDGTNRYANSRSFTHWLKDPAGAIKACHKPEVDVALSILRLRRFDIRDFESATRGLPAQSTGRAIDRLRDGIGHHFRAVGVNGLEWKIDAYLHLDEYVAQIVDCLDPNGSGTLIDSGHTR